MRRGGPWSALDRKVWLERVARRLARAEQGVSVRIARDLVRRCRAADGKSRREARRALKRHLARVVFRLLRVGSGDPPRTIKVRGGKVRAPALA